MCKIDIYEKIELLKEKIDGYYHANEECINVAEQKHNWESAKYFQGLNFSLDRGKRIYVRCWFVSNRILV